ncbi:MAG: ATP-binding protein [Planctomycetaceae bacterium]|jgi:predicted AAA+ superfamily ATPase|nr:ATP-binding protein [Planctomycetaceae bacterium]
MIQRTLSSTFIEVSDIFPVILLTGMRQVGKSTLLEMLKTAGRKYVSLDSFDDRTLAKNNPALFIQRYEPPVMIDEIQYAPELFTAIKIHVDKNRQNGQFWLTGSQKFSLMKGIQESLAGRVAILEMLGFSFRETIDKANEVKPFLEMIKNLKSENDNTEEWTLKQMYQTIFNGSFPQMIVNKGKGRDVFFKSYLQTYIERDVRDYHGITNNLKFYNFVRSVAVRTGNLLNYSDLSRDVEIDVRTTKTWLDILERSGLIRLLYPYHLNLTKRIIKTPKIYFMDTGLCAYLAGMESPETLEAGYLTGSILETYAFIQIYMSYLHNGKEPGIYFYRDADQKEIDFLIEQNGMIFPVEVKKNASPTMNDAKNFAILKKLKKPIGQGTVLCLRNSSLPLAENVTAIPMWNVA